MDIEERARKIWNEIPRDLGSERWIQYIADQLRAVEEEADRKGFERGTKSYDEMRIVRFIEGKREGLLRAAEIAIDKCRHPEEVECQWHLLAQRIRAEAGKL